MDGSRLCGRWMGDVLKVNGGNNLPIDRHSPVSSSYLCAAHLSVLSVLSPVVTVVTVVTVEIPDRSAPSRDAAVEL